MISIHRKSSGFSRGVSKYRGVARYDEIKPFLFLLTIIVSDPYVVTGIIITEDGKLESGESLATNISISALTVSW